MAIRLRSATNAPVNAKFTVERPNSADRLLTRVMQFMGAGLLAAVVISSSGCSLTSGACRMVTRGGCIDDFMIGYRNQTLAAKAWYEEKHCFESHCHLRDLHAGYMAGFADVAGGSDGCVPSIAPSSYWGWRYQSADGQNAVNAWFQGYPLGVRAAERAGIAHWGQVRPMGANAPEQRQAVYVPPPARTRDGDRDENPFYSRDRYEAPPYEPVESEEGDADDMEESDAEDVASPIRDALEEGLDDRPLGTDDASPPDPPADVRDAIRDALQGDRDDAGDAIEAVRDALDDSANNAFPFQPQASATVGDSTFSLSDSTPGMVEEVYSGRAGKVAETVDASIRELPFTFE